jgi:hypothetical protein
VHRIEIEQIARPRPPHPCRATPARVRLHFAPSHAPLALLQQQFGDRAPYHAGAARRAGDQNGICHVFGALALSASWSKAALTYWGNYVLFGSEELFWNFPKRAAKRRRVV